MTPTMNTWRLSHLNTWRLSQLIALMDTIWRHCGQWSLKMPKIPRSRQLFWISNDLLGLRHLGGLGVGNKELKNLRYLQILQLYLIYFFYQNVFIFFYQIIFTFFYRNIFYLSFFIKFVFLFFIKIFLSFFWFF